MRACWRQPASEAKQPLEVAFARAPAVSEVCHHIIFPAAHARHPWIHEATMYGSLWLQTLYTPAMRLEAKGLSDELCLSAGWMVPKAGSLVNKRPLTSSGDAYSSGSLSLMAPPFNAKRQCLQVSGAPQQHALKKSITMVIKRPI